MENGDGGEAAGETKMAAAGLTNGHVNGESVVVAGEVVTRSKPQVTESFRSSENVGENSSDVERYKSKMTEFSDVGKSSVANEKQYEENALKAMREKDGDSEMSSTTETRLAQKNRVETSDTGATKSHYSENQDKKHETTSQSTEKVGDMTATMSTSETSQQKSAVSIDASSDGSHAVLVDLGNDTSSKSVEEIQGDNFKGTRRVETSKSERQMEYTSHSGGAGSVGGGGGGRGQLDLGSQFDELFGSKGEHSKKDRDRRNVSFQDSYEAAREKAGALREYDDMEYMNQDYRKRPVRYEPTELEDDEYQSSGRGYSSRQVRGGKQDYMEDADQYRKSSWGLSTDRRTADDLVQRILSESRGGPAASPRAPRSFDDERSYSPSTRPFSPSTRFSPGGPRLHDEDGPYSPSPSPSALKKDKIFKVDMGDAAMVQSPKIAEGAGNVDRAGGHNGEHGMELQEFQVPPIRRKPRPQQEEMSLLDRRLASMGFDTKLGQQMYVKKESGGNEGYVETTYISKKKPPGTFLGEEDDLDDEIDTMRSTLHENLQRRNRILQEEYNDEEDSQTSGGSGHSGYRSRGRMVRQQYVDETDSFGYRPRAGTPPEDYIPDDEFVPKKRPETEEVVKEKTTNIRTVIEKQSSVLEKLRDASNSFDDLNNEIRSIKQQFMENQMKRTYIMQDDGDHPEEEGPPGRGYDPRYGGVRGYVTGAPDPDDGYRPYIPRKQRIEMQRSRSMYDDGYSTQRSMEDPEYDQCQMREPLVLPEGRAQGQYEPMEDDDDALGYGGQPSMAARRHYDSSTTSNYTSSATASRYLARPTFNRANTVSDFNFERPSSPGFKRHDRYDRPSTFSSRFLDKVRDRKTTGGGIEAESASKRDRPFKSRFLRDSFAGSSSTSSSYSKSTYSSKSTRMSSTEMSAGSGSASASADISPVTSNDAASPSPKGGADSANTESTATE